MSCANQSNYDLGDAVKLYGDFTNPDTGEFSDPVGEISVTIRDPNGTETQYVYGTDVELVRSGIGQYHAVITVSIAGNWFYRWASVDAAQEEKRFYVKAGIVTPAS